MSKYEVKCVVCVPETREKSAAEVIIGAVRAWLSAWEKSNAVGWTPVERGTEAIPQHGEKTESEPGLHVRKLE